MDILLTDIQARLTTLVTDLKYIDEDWGQLDDYSPHFPVKWPCALVDCFNASYTDLGNTVQHGLCTIRIVLADVRLSNSSTKAPTAQKENSRSFYTLMKQVYTALQGYAGHPHYSALIRISERRLPRNDGVKAHEMLFTVQVKNVLAKKQTVVFATTGLDVQIETN